MKLQQIPKFDFADFVSLNIDERFRQLFTRLNQHVEGVQTACSGKLSLGDNLNAVVRTVEFTFPDPWEPLILTPYGTSVYNSGSHGVPAVMREGNKVKGRGLVRHRATNITGFAQPVFKVPDGYWPMSSYIVSSSYEYAPATLDIDKATGLGYLAYALNAATVSSFFDVNNLDYITTQAEPSGKAPFPIEVTVEGLSSAPKAVQVSRCVLISGVRKTNVDIPRIKWSPSVAKDREATKQVVILENVYGLIPGNKYALDLLVMA